MAVNSVTCALYQILLGWPNQVIWYGRGISLQNAWMNCEVLQFSGRTSMERPLRKKIPRDMRMTLSNRAKAGSDKNSSWGFMRRRWWTFLLCSVIRLLVCQHRRWFVVVFRFALKGKNRVRGWNGERERQSEGDIVRDWQREGDRVREWQSEVPEWGWHRERVTAWGWHRERVTEWGWHRERGERLRDSVQFLTIFMNV
jgi:hypothetical protein